MQSVRPNPRNTAPAGPLNSDHQPTSAVPAVRAPQTNTTRRPPLSLQTSSIRR